MSAFLYAVALQYKLDLRSKSLLITCYIVPLIFFLLMGGIFTSIMPEQKGTLIQMMIVMGCSMGALIGLPPSLIEIYGSDVKKLYKANGVPLFFGLAAMFLSAFAHLTIMSVVILLLAPLIFGAVIPESLLSFFAALAVFIVVSICVGCILGLAVKSQAKLTMIAQLVFLPSIMLSGIMVPMEQLPKVLQEVGQIFPAFWGYRLMLKNGLQFENLWYLLVVLVAAVLACGMLLKRQKLK